jgi:Predicted ABC-type transport system involved in lysophospholipase L1 biosynthesis, permease component
MMNLLKLVKYDWKRNSGFLLIVGSLFILAGAGITVYGGIESLDKDLIYVLTFLVYLAITVAVCVTACRTYERNLRYFNRRLLPLPALYTVLSPLLLGVAALVVIGVVGVLHLYALGAVLDTVHLRVSDVVGDKGFWAMLLSSALFIIYIFFCITVAKVFAGKKGSWIGAALFIALQLLFQWLENQLFPNMNVSTDQFFETVSVRITDAGDPADTALHIQASFPNFWGPLIFEVVVIVGLIYAMTYLINGKINARG